MYSRILYSIIIKSFEYFISKINSLTVLALV